MKTAAGILLVFALGCSNPENESVSMMKAETAPLTVGIPPIDAAAPAKVETATFALG